MKIAVNALSVVSGMTGIGCYTHDLLSSLAKYGELYHYLFITGTHFSQMDINNKSNITQLKIDKPNRLWEELQMPTELLSHGVELYHSPIFTCPIIDEIPAVITIHDTIPEIHPELCSQNFLNFYQERIHPSLRAAKKIITTSIFSRNEISKYLKINPEKISVIYQGISDKFSPENKNQITSILEKFKLPEKYILYVGMIESRKNIETLIAAFGKIAKEIKDYWLIIVGRHDDKNYTLEKAIEESSNKERIKEMGYMEDTDLKVLYAGAEVFVFPSLYEGFGRPVVEAMASGTAVIASDTSSLPEIVDEAGILVPPKDSDILAENLLKICKDSQIRNSFINRGLKRAKEFTYSKFAKQLMDFYKECEELVY